MARTFLAIGCRPCGVISCVPNSQLLAGYLGYGHLLESVVERTGGGVALFYFNGILCNHSLHRGHFP